MQQSSHMTYTCNLAEKEGLVPPQLLNTYLVRKSTYHGSTYSVSFATEGLTNFYIRNSISGIYSVTVMTVTENFFTITPFNLSLID